LKSLLLLSYIKVHYHEQNTCHWTAHPVSIRSMLIFIHHTCISQVVYFCEVWQPKFYMLFSFPLIIPFARFCLIFSCHNLKAHYFLSSKLNIFSDFEVFIEGNIWTQQSSRLEQNYIMKVFILCTYPQHMNGVVK